MHRFLGPATPTCIDISVRPPPCASISGSGHLHVHRFLGPPNPWCIDFWVRPPSCASISRSGHRQHRFLGPATPFASISRLGTAMYIDFWVRPPPSPSGHPHVHRFLSPGTCMCIDFSVRPYLCTSISRCGHPHVHRFLFCQCASTSLSGQRMNSPSAWQCIDL